jgi:hypothetical protein
MMFVEAGIKGESVTSTEVAVSAVAGALGSAIGGRLATNQISAAEKAAASSNNVVSGISNSTLGAIRQGGPIKNATAGSSELTQKAADVATGSAGKKVDDASK